MNESINFYYIIDKFLDKVIDNHVFEFIKFNDSLSTSLINQFKRNCYTYVYKILDSEYNNFKKIKNIPPYQALQEFYNYLDFEEYIDTLNYNFPVLKKLLNIEAKNFVNFSNELFENLKIHKMYTKFQKINSVQLGIGDPHNNGKTVCKLDIDNKVYFYKPRNAQMDKEFHNFVRQFLPEYTINIFSYDEFSIHEEIQHFPSMESQSDIESYYFNIGFISSIFYFLKTTDMHYENLIVSHTNPVFIDLETLSDNTDNIDLPKNKFNSLYSDSIFQSMIYPLQTSKQSLDISALTGRFSTNENFFYQNETVQLNSNGEFIFKNEDVIMEKQKNEIYLNNIKQEPVSYIKEIINGFSKFANEVLKNPKKISNDLFNILENNKIRQVIRPTHVYEKYLNSSTNPYYLKNRINYNNIFNNIKNLFTVEIYKSEIDSLSKRDIPLFYTTLNSKNLYCDTKLVSENFFTKTIKESINEKITNFSQVKLIYEINNIINSLFVYFNNNNNLRIDSLKVIKNYSDDYNFHKYISVYENKNSALAPYFDGENFNISILTPSLFDFGGTLILEALKDKNKTQNNLFKNIILTMERCKTFDTNFISGINGFGGFLYLLINLYNIYNDKWFYNKLSFYIKKLSKKDLKDLKIPKLDYFTGIAGFMTILLNIHPYLKEDTVIEGNKLFLKTLNNYIKRNHENLHYNKNKIGLSHGYSGLLIPLSLYNKIFETKENDKLINKLLQIEESYYNKHSNNYYDLRNNKDNHYYLCYGIIGILLSRLELIRNGVNIKIDNKVESLLQQLNELQFPKDFSYCLCHGFSSIIELLVELRKFYQCELIDELIQKIIINVNKTYYNGLGNLIPFNGFFLGEGGVEYVKLKEQYNSHSIVLLKIFDSTYFK